MMEWAQFAFLMLVLLICQYRKWKELRAWRTKIEKDIAEDKELIRQLREKRQAA